MPLSNAAFLARLEAEAARQAQLSNKRLLPAQLDWLTSFVGRFPWQVLVVSAAITAVLMEVGP
jgi:hypothetical protein